MIKDIFLVEDSNRIISFTKKGLFLNIKKIIMKISIFNKKNSKSIIPHNKVVIFLKTISTSNTAYLFLVVIGISVNNWFSSVLDMLFNISHFNEAQLIKFLQLLIFIGLYIPSIFYIVFKYKDIPEHVLVCPNVKGMSKLSDYFDYYSTLLPFSLISTGIVLITLGNLNKSFPFYGVFFSIIGILIFGVIIDLKTILYNRGKYETYNNLVKANDIFANYISLNKTRESRFAIKQFTKYFLRAVDSIDLYLDKGIKIDHLKSEENIPVKQALIYYLPVYLKYGSEAEIYSFENNLNSMTKLVNEKNTMNSLDIINVVYSIYQDITKFLKQHNYVVPKNIRYLNLRHNIKSWLENIIMFLMIIFILIGLIKDIIPYEHINSYLAKLFGLAVISVPLLEISLKYYKLLKE